MKTRIILWVVSAYLIIPSVTVASGPPQVSFENGLLTVSCFETPLAQVFEQIRTTTGMELLLEDPIKTRLLTAHIEAQPVHLAIERLLEGSGVNYAMSFDYQNWQRVAKIFIGGGGESPSTSSQQVEPQTQRRLPRRPSPTADPDEDPDMADPFEDYVEEEPPEEMEDDFGMEEPGDMKPPSSDFVPPPPSYPRSSFTPGLESSPFGSTPQQGQQPGASTNEDGSNPPPAYYPFLDPFGRPIPVPPGQRPPQQPQPKKKQQQNP